MSSRENVKKQLEGAVFQTKNFGKIEVLEYCKSSKVLVKFLDTGNEKYCHSSSIRDGNIKDRFAPTVCGVGIIGDEISRCNGVIDRCYDIWSSMLDRCFNEKIKQKYPTYRNCSMCDDWRYLSKFKEWYLHQIGHDQIGWCLDKDILVKGNKEYSPETCCFVPHQINCVVVSQKSSRGDNPVGVIFKKENKKFCAGLAVNGSTHHLGYYDNNEQAWSAYKVAKETYIKELANKWNGQIDIHVYEALMNWKVEITD